MKSSLYSTPVVQSLQNHHPVVVSVCGMCKPNLNALHARILEVLQIKVLQIQEHPFIHPYNKKLDELSKIVLADSKINSFSAFRSYLVQLVPNFAYFKSLVPQLYLPTSSVIISCALSPTPCIEPVQATLIENMSWLNFYQFHPYRADQDSIINIKFGRNCVFTFEGDHDFLFLHLTTLKTFQVGIIFRFGVEGIFTIQGDFYK